MTDELSSIRDTDYELLLRLSLQAYFLLTSAAVLFVRFIPPLRQEFIPYGKTLTDLQQSPSSLLQWLSKVTVPKNWFWHYYLLSVGLSVLWGYQALSAHFGFLDMLRRVDGRTAIVWSMMLVQGCRRLYESLDIQRKSPARMWFGHYLVGCAFYAAMSITVWVDGRERGPGAIVVGLNLCRCSLMAVNSCRPG